MSGYVLDSFALLAWLNAEPSAAKVRNILQSRTTAISAINVGEVAYILRKRFDASKVDLFLQRLPSFPFEIVTPALEDILEAAALKAKYPISYADAFAAQLALKRKQPLVTGDPEFRAVPGLKLTWLP